jgi:hypothetical protein
LLIHTVPSRDVHFACPFQKQEFLFGIQLKSHTYAYEVFSKSFQLSSLSSIDLSMEFDQDACTAREIPRK